MIETSRNGHAEHGHNCTADRLLCITPEVEQLESVAVAAMSEPTVHPFADLLAQLRGFRDVLVAIDNLRPLFQALAQGSELSLPKGERLPAEDQLRAFDFEILRALAKAKQPLQSQQLSRALGLDPENSTPRVRLSPKFALRAGGYATLIKEEGYSITEEGLRLIEAKDRRAAKADREPDPPPDELRRRSEEVRAARERLG